MNDIRFTRIGIRYASSNAAKAGEAFLWEADENKPINIFYYPNNAGKTTLYNIIYDVIDYKNQKGDDIFTEDLYLKGIQVEIQFKTKNHQFTIHKSYVSGSVEIHVIDMATGKIERLETRHDYKKFIEKLLGIPQNISFLKSEKISFFNLLHLHYVNDKEYHSALKGKHHYCTIANHNFDGISRPLFYYYVFNTFVNNEELAEAYELGSEYRSLEKQLKNYGDLAKLTVEKKKNPDVEQNLFDSENEIKNLDAKKREISQMKIEVYNYKESYKIICEVIQKLRKISETQSEKKSQISAWISVLSANKSQIEKAILRLETEEIPAMQKQRKAIESRIEGLEEYEIEKIKDRYDLAKKTVKADTNTVFDFLRDMEVTEAKFKQAREAFQDMLKKLQKHSLLTEFNETMQQFLPEGVSAELSLEEGNMKVNTSSDSMNRIVRFVALAAFLMLKDRYDNLNHFNFLFADSPFIGTDTPLLHDTMMKLFKVIKEKHSKGQFFIFLNKNNDGEYADAFNQYADIIHLDTGSNKIFKFD